MTEAQTMLEPCPFCGGNAIRRGEFIECADCSAQGPTDREAVTGWNARASTAITQPVAWQWRQYSPFAEGWTEWREIPEELAKSYESRPRKNTEIRCLYAALPASQPDGVRSALEALVNAVMRDISEAKRRLDADRPKDGPVHPVSAFLTGLAIDVGKAQAALSRPAVDGDGREATIRECAEIAENFRRQVLPGDRGIIRKIEEAILALTAQPPKDGSRVPRPERGGSK